MPRRRAASTTMMLAIEPTISRLPAKVLTSASIGPENGSVAAGSSSITAGKVGKTLDHPKGAPKNGAGPGRRPPAGGRAGARPPGQAGGPDAGGQDEQPGERDNHPPPPPPAP